MDPELVAVILARLELKVDQLIAGGNDHEARLRMLETKGFVTGKQLWAGLVGSATVASAFAALMIVYQH